MAKENGFVTLMVHGEEMTFSEQELIAILEDRFPKKTRNPVIPKPTEDQWFQVKPLEIDQSLFEEEREDVEQEETRKTILKAFEEVNKNPQKYGGKFETMMPKKTWGNDEKTVMAFREMAFLLGHHMADWMEQALEWAQRISNGETWDDVCNRPDTANWYRVVIWRKGYARLVGGAKALNILYSASDVSLFEYTYDESIDNAVPLVVRYKK